MTALVYFSTLPAMPIDTCPLVLLSEPARFQAGARSELLHLKSTFLAVTIMQTNDDTWALQAYLSQHLPTRRPPQTLAQAIQKPEAGEDDDRGGPGECHIDGTHYEEADGEEPAGAHLVRQHATDEFADGVCQGLTAGDQACEAEYKDIKSL